MRGQILGYNRYHRAYHDVEIVDSCSSFPNVPLLGTKRGINYNIVLARRHLGYPMRDKPNSIHARTGLQLIPPFVPRKGTKEGINYNPVLAQRQLGYLMRDKPDSIHLSGFFLKEGEDHKKSKEGI